MYLSKGEYCQFSLKGRLNLLYEFGTFINEKYVDEIKIKIFILNDFYVEVIYNDEKVIKAEPVLSAGMLYFYLC